MAHIHATTSTTIRDACGVTPSPAVAYRIDRFVRGEQQAARELALALTPAQVRGGAPLPVRLPLTPASRANLSLASCDPHHLRLLLMTALDVTGRADVLLDASGVDPSTLWEGPAAQCLVFSDGLIRFRDERVRSLAVERADADAVQDAHAALARATRRAAMHAAALLHTLESRDAAADSVVSGHALRVASGELSRGNAEGAYRLAQAAADRAPGRHADRLRAVAGRAALWSGWLEEARTQLSQAEPSASAALLETIDRLRQGPPDDPDPRLRAHVVVDWLAEVAEARADTQLCAAIQHAGHLWYADELEEADKAVAQIFLIAGRALSDATWDVGSDRMTPLIHAQLCAMETGALIQVRAWSDAAEILSRGATHLPLEWAAAGVVPAYVRAFAEMGCDIDPSLADQYDQVLATSSPVYRAPGPVGGVRALAASRVQRPKNAAGLPIYDDSELTARQRDVLRLVLKGLTNREIGERLHISERTVEVHLGHIYRKTGAGSRSALLAGIIHFPSPHPHA